MLSQFQKRYPSGCLISDLLTIYQGLYVVRAVVQIEGIVKATGLAAATVLEVAEDQARERALAILELETVAPSTTLPKPPEAPRTEPLSKVPAPSPVSPIPSERPTSPPQDQEPPAVTSSSPRKIITTPAPSALPVPSVPPPLPIIPDQQLESDDWLEADYGLGEDSPLSRVFEDLTPGSDPLDSGPAPEKPTWLTESREDLTVSHPSVSAPTDLSEELIQIQLLLDHLAWTDKQEKEFLKQTYGKLSRELLADEELLEYLTCLEIFAKVDEQVKRLRWNEDPKQGRDFLEQNYGKKSRLHLTPEELHDFLERLEQLPAPDA